MDSKFKSWWSLWPCFIGFYNVFKKMFLIVSISILYTIEFFKSWNVFNQAVFYTKGINHKKGKNENKCSLGYVVLFSKYLSSRYINSNNYNVFVWLIFLMGIGMNWSNSGCPIQDFLNSNRAMVEKTIMCRESHQA